jgi:nicotinamide mononucleotide transporter
MILNYIQTNWIEIVGAILSLIYLYLSIKQKISLWIFGFMSSAFYIIVFFQTRFYADMSLQLYYLLVSVYGWINWHKIKPETGNELPATNTSKRTWLQLIVAGILIFAVYYLILSRFTDSSIPISDSIVGMLSVLATWMLAKKLLENWLVWIAADALACGLFFYKGLYVTTFLFVIYTAMAVVGYYQWKKKHDESIVIYNKRHL